MREGLSPEVQADYLLSSPFTRDDQPATGLIVMAPTPLLIHPLRHSYTLSRTSSTAGGVILLVPQALSPIIGRPFPDLESRIGVIRKLPYPVLFSDRVKTKTRLTHLETHRPVAGIACKSSLALGKCMMHMMA